MEYEIYVNDLINNSRRVIVEFPFGLRIKLRLYRENQTWVINQEVAYRKDGSIDNQLQMTMKFRKELLQRIRLRGYLSKRTEIKSVSQNRPLSPVKRDPLPSRRKDLKKSINPL